MNQRWDTSKLASDYSKEKDLFMETIKLKAELVCKQYCIIILLGKYIYIIYRYRYRYNFNTASNGRN